METISVVIPTYNRSPQLSEVLGHILKCDTEGFSQVEIIVVDDGSNPPTEIDFTKLKVKQPFGISLIRQTNAGPAAARNNGFRAAKGEVVLFVDDDVLLSPMALRLHTEAHQKMPNSVIFGAYPYVIPDTETPSYRYMKTLVDEGLATFVDMGLPEFIKVNTLASGNLSVQKHMFSYRNGVYDHNMKIPAAEEFELIARLAAENIPVYFAPYITALHTQPTMIADKCKQEYKYGLGIAEVYIKDPRADSVAALKNFMRSNGIITRDDPFKIKLAKILKSPISKKAVRSGILRFVEIMETLKLSDRILFPLYDLLAGLHLFAGVRDGLKRFTTEVKKPMNSEAAVKC